MVSDPKSLAAEIEREARKVLCRRIQQAAPGIFGHAPCNGETVVCGWCDVTARLQVEASIAALATTPEGRTDRA